MNQGIKIPSILTLHQEKSIKETSKIDIYNIVLNKCVEKIVFTNRNTDKTFIIFEVPKILIGYPSYDMKNCILFILQQLSLKGYLVEFVEPFYLYIDWGSKPTLQSDRVQKNFSTPHNLDNKTKLQQNSTKQKLQLLFNKYPDLNKYPNSKIEFVYEDKSTSKRNKKNKRK